MPSIKMYTTAYCPYCIRAKQFLQSRGVAQIEEIRIDSDTEARRSLSAVPMWVATMTWWRWTDRAVCSLCWTLPEARHQGHTCFSIHKGQLHNATHVPAAGSLPGGFCFVKPVLS